MNQRAQAPCTIQHWSGKHSDSHVLSPLSVFWELLSRDRLVETVFYDGHIHSCEDFYAFMSRPGRVVYTLSAAKRPLAMCWLDNVEASSARIHFFFYRWAAGPLARKTGHHVIHWLLHSKKQDGEYHFDTLIGLTPRNNPLAVRFIKHLGFTVLGTIPHAIVLADGSRVGGLVSYVTRDIYQPGGLRHAQCCASEPIENRRKQTRHAEQKSIASGSPLLYRGKNLFQEKRFFPRTPFSKNLYTAFFPLFARRANKGKKAQGPANFCPEHPQLFSGWKDLWLKACRLAGK